MSIVDNKKAFFDYFIEDRYEAGLELEGWEVKAIRAGRAQIKEAYVIVKSGALWLLGSHIALEGAQHLGDVRQLAGDFARLLGKTVTVTGTAYGFSVHDDGPGFPPGLAATAFERFVRGDSSRTRAPKGATPDGDDAGSGAGLGLSLVHAIVSAHGGSVTLDSSPGSTTIAVTLPR